MSDHENPMGSASILKQKLFEALRGTVAPSEEGNLESVLPEPGIPLELGPNDTQLENGESVYSLLGEEESEVPLTPELQESSIRLTQELQRAQLTHDGLQSEEAKKTDFDGTLSMRGVVPDAQTEAYHPAGAPSSSIQAKHVKSDSLISGGSMADLSGYKDLSKAPISFGDEEMSLSSLSSDLGSSYERVQQQHQQFSAAQHFVQESAPQEVDTEFSGNVKTLIRLVNELPEGVTKQTGAQIIRLTMEAMGISMEDVLSEAQSAQSEMLDAVRANIKKIEEYKTVIRKLETDIKYYQGKANELSEIIDLFILSNTSGGSKMSMPEDLGH